jgi:nucleoside-diphosphate-sugar epimerase
VVFHQAALPSVPRSLQDPRASIETNAGGTMHVLLAARDAGVRRLVFASSSSVYGPGAPLPKREGGAVVPISPYAASKLAGEAYCRAFGDSYELETVALRYFNVFGPRQPSSNQYAAVIPTFVAAALDGGAPPIFGNGEQSRDFTHVENVVEANMLAVRAPSARGQAINIACGESTTVNELLRLIETSMGLTLRPRYLPARQGEVRHSSADVSLARRELGYVPLVGIEEGLRRLTERRGARSARGSGEQRAGVGISGRR